MTAMSELRTGRACSALPISQSHLLLFTLIDITLQKLCQPTR